MYGTAGPVTVREAFTLLRRWQVRLAAGEAGLGNMVTWVGTMHARLPAFEGFQSGELAMLSLGTLHKLRASEPRLTLEEAVRTLAEIGAAAVVVAGWDDAAPDEQGLAAVCTFADAHALPLLLLHAQVPLTTVEREVLDHIVARRERQAQGYEPAAERARLRDEALEALLSGTYVGEPQMRTRAAQLGFDLSRPHAVLVVERIAQARHARAMAAALTESLGAWTLVRDARAASGQSEPTGAVVALLPLREGVADEQALTVLLAGASGAEAAWGAGIGEPARAPAEVRRSATQARDAARLGLLVYGPGHVARQAELGVYHLLLTLRDAGELAPFVARTLAPLNAEARGTPALLETLEAFFACNGNLSEAARHLHLHRNSLLYRLNRASELLGGTLDDPDLRLSLQLAIKGRRVLDV